MFSSSFYLKTNKPFLRLERKALPKKQRSIFDKTFPKFAAKLAKHFWSSFF